MKYFEIQLVGDPTRARATVQQALESRNFRLSATDDWSAVAERAARPRISSGARSRST